MIRLTLLSLLIAAAMIQESPLQARRHQLLVLNRAIHESALLFGHDKCKMDQGAPCGEKTCAAHGKQTPPYCSPKCHKDCCFCAKSCNGHNPERQPNPDEGQE